jgi:hypothetical protein
MQLPEMFVLLRTGEHLIVVGIGIFVIWLGYQLFRNMPVRREGEAKIALLGTSISLSRVGPGIFFVLCGTMLIGYTVTRTFEYETDGKTSRIHGMFPTSEVALPQNAMPIERLVGVLARMATDIPPQTSSDVQREIALRETRARLMLQEWNPDWGDQEEFVRWVFIHGARTPPPQEVDRGAVKVFTSGDFGTSH